jgi:hypothetical protein
LVVRCTASSSVFDFHLTLCVDALHTFGIGAELGHRALERAEVVDHGLVDQDVAVGQEQDALLGAALPQAPDDLEGGVGLAGAGGHDQQHAVLPGGDGLHGAVDGIELVVARRLAGRIVGRGDATDVGAPAFPGTVTAPQLIGAGELIEGEVLLQHAIGAGGVAEHEPIAVAGKAERDVKQVGVPDGLLHAGAHGVLVVLGFDHGQRDVGFVEQSEIGSQHGGGVALRLLAADHHTTRPQRELSIDLVHAAPPRCHHGGPDELVAEVAFRKVLLNHSSSAMAAGCVGSSEGRPLFSKINDLLGRIRSHRPSLIRSRRKTQPASADVSR